MGWALGIVDELLWIIYAVLTRQWPFVVSAIVYGTVCARNLRAWRRRHGEERLLPVVARCTTCGYPAPLDVTDA